MKAIFRGRFHAKLDGKGRLSLPAGLRGCFQEDSIQAVITNSIYKKSPCLDIYLPDEWEKLEAKIDKLSKLKPSVQAYQRFYISGGQSIEADSQSRILLPKSLRSYAGLKGEVVLVGMGNKLELWDESQWNKVHSNLAQNFEETLAEIAELELQGGE